MRTTSIMHSLGPSLLLACLSSCAGSAPEPSSSNEPTDPTSSQVSNTTPTPTEAEKDRLWFDVEEQKRVLAQPLPEYDPNDPVVARLLKPTSEPGAEARAQGSEHVGVAQEGLTSGPRFFDCMQQYAASAYEDPAKRANVCDTQIVQDIGTTQMDVQQGPLENGGQEIVIAFRGTASLEDTLTDLKSEYRVKSTNELDSSIDVANPGLVGSGWKARWHEQLGANQGRLQNLLWDLRKAGHSAKYVELHFVGHSLGAVTAELAALDTAAYFNDDPEIYVDVTGFNPPKLGDARLRDRYQALLLANAIKFRIAQFSRSGDLVHNVPKAIPPFWHPVWNFTVGSKVIGEGSTKELPYCPQFNLAGYRLPLAAHTLADWATQLDQRPDNGKCLFAELMQGSGHD